MFPNLVFTIFSLANMAVMAFIIAIIYLYKATHKYSVASSLGLRLKVFNWIIVGLSFTFLAVHSIHMDVNYQRALLRMSFGLMMLSDIGYNFNVLILAIRATTTKLKDRHGNSRRTG